MVRKPWEWWCERCGLTEGLRFESSRTCYYNESKLREGRRKKLRMLELEEAEEDPNRDIVLCRECAVEHHAYWDEMWKEYYYGRL